LSEVPTLEPRYNIAPTTSANGVAKIQSDRRFQLLRWGLIPSWAKDPAIGARLINARAETGGETLVPSRFSATLFSSSRWLLEWQRQGAKNTVLFPPQDGRPLPLQAVGALGAPDDGERLARSDN